MKKEITKTEAQKQINNFFAKDSFSSEETKKIKRLAMKFKIKLGFQRKFFCKKCFSKLRGKLSVSRTHKTVVCRVCNHKNKSRIS